MKKLLTLILTLCSTDFFAATIYIKNTLSDLITVIIDTDSSSETLYIPAGKTEHYNSWLSPIHAITWKYSVPQKNNDKIFTMYTWKAILDMPALNVEGNFIIKPDGQFNSSRLGDNKQAQKVSESSLDTRGW